MIISAIVAVSDNRVIGKDNQLPWYLPADLKYFKKKTIRHPVIMGRKSFESIGKPLPKRTNIVVSRNPYYMASGVLIAHSLEEAIELANDTNSNEAFIIGGAEIFAMALDNCDKLYITEVHGTFEGDVYFPEWDKSKWKLVDCVQKEADGANPFAYTFKIYERL
ncbi:dihydrofolate reductase [Membranihabitans maritimus]|uniref:dihydrofolate reductase n=1 Tax=Membranihabitans maritimus TaxID=2904244 RepID=UPI001F233DBC|nr:dihydrofolate reductase [Membranihabitans maritimus]